MNELLEKKSIQFFLTIVVVAVWGYNMFTLADISANTTPLNKEEEIIFKKNFFKVPGQLGYVYKADFRDPFKPQLKRQDKKESSPKKQKISAQPLQPPHLILSGVIEGTALIKGKGEKIYFAGPGDIIEGVRIKSIYRDSVVMVFQNKKFTINL